MKRFAIVVLALAVLLAFGCGKKEQPAQAPAAPATPASASSTATDSAPAESFSGAPASEADAKLIRQAVEDHVRNDQGIKLSAMEMTVDPITVNGDHAVANATFHVKQGGASMGMSYSLERHANGWIVLKSQPSEGQFMHPPMDKTHSGTPQNPGGPAMPDVQDYFKSHPAPSSN